MFRKKIILVVLLVFVSVNTAFSQLMAIDDALSNAAKDISESVPQGTRIAVLNISSDFMNLSDYIINELIVNPVNLRKFQIVPHSTIELEAANMEFDFQMTGNVSDDSQKRLGQFLGAGTIISGTVTRDSANSYRLVINTIDLESFTFQSSFRVSIQNDRQIKTLIADSGGIFYEDYTTGERIGIGALNMFFGIGSIANGHHIGWLVTGVEAVGITFLVIGLGYNPVLEKSGWDNSNNKKVSNEEDYRSYDSRLRRKSGFITTGSIIIGGAVLFGYIIPFFHHKPNQTVSQNDFPFNLELVSLNNQDINGVRLLYNMKF